MRIVLYIVAAALVTVVAHAGVRYAAKPMQGAYTAAHTPKPTHYDY